MPRDRRATLTSTRLARTRTAFPLRHPKTVAVPENRSRRWVVRMARLSMLERGRLARHFPPPLPRPPPGTSVTSTDWPALPGFTLSLGPLAGFPSSTAWSVSVAPAGSETVAVFVFPPATVAPMLGPGRSFTSVR